MHFFDMIEGRKADGLSSLISGAKLSTRPAATYITFNFVVYFIKQNYFLKANLFSNRTGETFTTVETKASSESFLKNMCGILFTYKYCIVNKNKLLGP